MTVLVGLISAYKEGELVRQAVASTLRACERVYVCEGPAGDPIDDDRVPDSDLGGLESDERVTVSVGRWRTDARKRQAMLESVQRDYGTDRSVWGVIVDADEVLWHGEYLRDWLLRLDYTEQLDETGGSRYLGRPLRLVELDGSVSWARGRLLRLDRMRRYRVSTSVFEHADGLYTGAGNVPDYLNDWAAPRSVYLEGDNPRMMVMPPLPTEPFLVHRSILRHPLRAGLRLHEQERAELLRAGMPVE